MFKYNMHKVKNNKQHISQKKRKTYKNYNLNKLSL